uniref:Uncharacterized protein n=1 Tax=Brassica oleracea var. oleracea TaxID=109376 RepID=A0A0D3EI32_BRAOL
MKGMVTNVSERSKVHLDLMGQDYSFTQPSSSAESLDMTSLLEAECELYKDEDDSRILHQVYGDEADDGMPLTCYCGSDAVVATSYTVLQRRDATRRLGLSALQKCTAAIRLLAYGTAADAVDEYLRLSETTALSCLHNFTDGIIHIFGEEYLRRPTP